MLSGDLARMPFLPRRTEGTLLVPLFGSDQFGKGSRETKVVNHRAKVGTVVLWPVSVCMRAQCEEDPEVAVDMT